MFETGLDRGIAAHMSPEALVSYNAFEFQKRFWTTVSILGFGALIGGLFSFPENSPLEWPESGYVFLGGLIAGYGALGLAIRAHNRSVALIPRIPDGDED